MALSGSKILERISGRNSLKSPEGINKENPTSILEGILEQTLESLLKKSFKKHLMKFMNEFWVGPLKASQEKFLMEESSGEISKGVLRDKGFQGKIAEIIVEGSMKEFWNNRRIAEIIRRHL